MLYRSPTVSLSKTTKILLRRCKSFLAIINVFSRITPDFWSTAAPCIKTTACLGTHHKATGEVVAVAEAAVQA